MREEKEEKEEEEEKEPNFKNPKREFYEMSTLDNRQPLVLEPPARRNNRTQPSGLSHPYGRLVRRFRPQTGYVRNPVTHRLVRRVGLQSIYARNPATGRLEKKNGGRKKNATAT